MVDLPSRWKTRQRSLTFCGHSNILNHYHNMFRSRSNRSSTRIDNESNASTNEAAASTQRRKSTHICGNHQSIKKAFSLILNKVDFSIRNPPDNNEMHEFVRQTNSEENLNTIHRSTSTIADNTIVHQRPLFPHHTCATTVQRTLSQLKNKFICRHEHTDDDHEKNNGYLVIVNPDLEPVLLPNDSFDHQQTQHAQPCVQINEISFDLNQIQYTSITPITPNVLPPQPTSLGPYVPPYGIRSNHELEAQSTRSSVECGVPHADFLDIHDTRMSHMISTTSPSSTNSSSHEYTGIDRSMLDDNEYVRAQELDLHRIIDVEINLLKEHHDLRLDLEDEVTFNSAYDEALKQNLNLKEELELLQEEHDRIYSQWSCELCTFLNPPYIDTGRDICEVCEGPSPLKRATLIK